MELVKLIGLTLLFTGISGLLYRMGGSWKFNTKYRDLGVPTAMFIYMCLAGHFHWTLILCFGLLFGSLTTYWKKRGADAKWFNWLFTGLGYSLAMLPFIIVTGHWLGFLSRTIVLTFGIVLISEKIGNVIIEEGGRGGLILLTMPLLFI